MHQPTADRVDFSETAKPMPAKSIPWKSRFLAFLTKTLSMDGRTDGRTVGPTDTHSYKDASQPYIDMRERI